MSEEYWKHILFRHPEVLPYSSVIMEAVQAPEEVFMDDRHGIHALKRIDHEHFLVVIYEEEHNREGFIRTAYIINERRRKRRYTQLRSTKLS